MSRKGIYKRREAAELLERAENLGHPAAGEARKVLQEVGVESPLKLKGNGPKGKKRLEALDKILGILEPLKGVSTDGDSNNPGNRSKGTPKNRLADKVQDLFDSATVKGLVSGSFADFIGDAGDLETALANLEELIAGWEAKQKTAQQAAIAEVVGKNQVSGPVPAVERERSDDTLSKVEVDELRLEPRYRRTDTESKGGSSSDSDGEESKPEVETPEAEEVVCEMPEPLGDSHGGAIATFEVRSEGWEREYLLHLTDGKLRVKMCGNCLDALASLKYRSPKAVWEGLVAFSEKVGRPVPECALHISKNCHGRTVRTAYKGSRYPIDELFGGEDEVPCCLPCKKVLVSALASLKSGDPKPLFEILSAKGVKPPEPVTKEVRKELQICEICGTEVENPQTLSASPTNQLTVCYKCWEIGVEPLATARQISGARGALEALAEGFGAAITSGIRGQITKVLKEAEGDLGAAVGYLAGKISENAEIFAAVAQLLIGAVEATEEPEERMEIDWANRPSCPNWFRRQNPDLCQGHIPPFPEDAVACKACWDHKESLLRYGPDERIEAEETYWFLCRKCHLAWSIRGTVLLGMKKLPPKNALLCGPCYHEAKEARRAKAAEAAKRDPTPVGSTQGRILTPAGAPA